MDRVWVVLMVVSVGVVDSVRLVSIVVVVSVGVNFMWFLEDEVVCMCVWVKWWELDLVLCLKWVKFYVVFIVKCLVFFGLGVCLSGDVVIRLLCVVLLVGY